MDDDQTILGLLHSLVKGQAELLEAFKTRHPPAGQEESSGRSENDRRSESSGRSERQEIGEQWQIRERQEIGEQRQIRERQEIGIALTSTPKRRPQRPPYAFLLTDEEEEEMRASIADLDNEDRILLDSISSCP